MSTRFSVSFCAVLEKNIRQHALFKLLQSCQKALDSSEYILQNPKLHLVHILKWFKANSLKANLGIFQLIIQILTLS